MKKYLLAIESAAAESSVAILELASTPSGDEASLRAPDRHWSAFNRSGSLNHAEQLLPMVDSLLADAGIAKTELAAVAFSQGPGAFTGLRIACGIAQGMALGLGLPLIPIDSLRASAQLAVDYLVENKQLKAVNAAQDAKYKLSGVDYIVTLLDARMGEAYMAIYQPQPLQAELERDAVELRVVQKPSLISIKDVLPWLDQQRLYDAKQLFFTGNALSVYAKELAASFETKEFEFSVLPGEVTEWADATVLARLAVKKLQADETIEAHLAAPIYLREKVAFTEKERAAGLSGNPSAVIPLISDAAPKASHIDELASITYSFGLGAGQYFLRPMKEADIAGALLIEQTVQDYPWTRGNFKDSLASGYPAWVIEHQLSEVDGSSEGVNRIVGFAVQMLAPDVAHVLLIAVEPSLQGEGFGTLLLQALEKNALNHGLDKQLLEVRRSNDQAQRFYLRHRYAVIGTRKGYYREVGGTSEDAIVLEKTLVPESVELRFIPRTEDRHDE
ncbi:MAG: tRNA (adenosine(37)-N6)-threonylcarbamoyltransferase complex dimerization subunit type 1 TsaB [Alcaligenaceae bacterium]|nr:tRNA (adenosine(37)-N6)-threonylcarbamoyltransferase complex dimerization subunit type 1 TsaB [Alcaligenaceae bacterium]